jgi:hypothetical protein
MIDFEVRSLFDKLNNIYAEFYSHFEYLAVDINIPCSSHGEPFPSNIFLRNTLWYENYELSNMTTDFTRSHSSPLQIYFLTCTQQLSNVMGY